MPTGDRAEMDDKRAPEAIDHRRQAIRGLHAALTVVVLAACVVGAHEILDFSASWIVGAAIAYPLSKAIGRMVLPQPGPLTDEERLRLVPPPAWLIVAAISIAAIHYGAGLIWLWSTAVTGLGMGALLIIELRQRDQARHRLAANKSKM
jgi:membrane associated rhomboid family serine protease